MYGACGYDLVLCGATVTSPAYMRGLLTALAADERLVVRLDAESQSLRQRVVDREPPSWTGLPHLLASVDGIAAVSRLLGDVDAVLSTMDTPPSEMAAQIRLMRPDVLMAPAGDKRAAHENAQDRIHHHIHRAPNPWISRAVRTPYAPLSRSQVGANPHSSMTRPAGKYFEKPFHRARGPGRGVRKRELEPPAGTAADTGGTPEPVTVSKACHAAFSKYHREGVRSDTEPGYHPDTRPAERRPPRDRPRRAHGSARHRAGRGVTVSARGPHIPAHIPPRGTSRFAKPAPAASIRAFRGVTGAAFIIRLSTPGRVFTNVP